MGSGIAETRASGDEGTFRSGDSWNLAGAANGGEGRSSGVCAAAWLVELYESRPFGTESGEADAECGKACGARCATAADTPDLGRTSEQVRTSVCSGAVRESGGLPGTPLSGHGVCEAGGVPGTPPSDHGVCVAEGGVPNTAACVSSGVIREAGGVPGTPLSGLGVREADGGVPNTAACVPSGVVREAGVMEHGKVPSTFRPCANGEKACG